MQEFIVSRNNESSQEPSYSLYVSFNDVSLESNPLVICSGAALITAGQQKQYWFAYNFQHSRDWTKILKLNIRSEDYKFPRSHLKKFGSVIACLINDFISQNN